MASLDPVNGKPSVQVYMLNKEIDDYISKNAPCFIKARSLDLNSSSIKIDHPIVVAADKCGIEKYGSPTLSDQSKISFPSIIFEGTPYPEALSATLGVPNSVSLGDE